MANGRSIKRGMAKQQAQAQPKAMAGGDLDIYGQEFAEAAVEGSGPEGRTEHMLSMIDPDELDQVSEGQKDQLEMINGMMTDMIYNPKTKEGLQEILQAGEPAMTIPKATNVVLEQFEQVGIRGQTLPLEMKFAAGMNAFGEITELAGAMGIVPKEIPEAELEPLIKATMEQYIMKGLKEKSIDPVELQQKIEPLLTPEEQLLGREMGSKLGVPQAPNAQMANEKMMQEKMLPLQVDNDRLKKVNADMSTALKGMGNTTEEGAV